MTPLQYAVSLEPPNQPLVYPYQGVGLRDLCALADQFTGPQLANVYRAARRLLLSATPAVVRGISEYGDLTVIQIVVARVFGDGVDRAIKQAWHEEVEARREELVLEHRVRLKYYADVHGLMETNELTAGGLLIQWELTEPYRLSVDFGGTPDRKVPVITTGRRAIDLAGRARV